MESSCFGKVVSQLSPVTAEARRPSSVTKRRACSPQAPNVSKDGGRRVDVRSAYVADFKASDEEAAATALTVVAWMWDGASV